MRKRRRQNYSKIIMTQQKERNETKINNIIIL